MKKVNKLLLATVLAIAAMTLPSESTAAKICDEEYYYDAAYTQWAGYCWKLCAPSPEYNCTGERTQYFLRVNCSPSCASLVEAPPSTAQTEVGPHPILQAQCPVARAGHPVSRADRPAGRVQHSRDQAGRR